MSQEKKELLMFDLVSSSFWQEIKAACEISLTLTHLIHLDIANRASYNKADLF